MIFNFVKEEQIDNPVNKTYYKKIINNRAENTPVTNINIVNLKYIIVQVQMNFLLIKK